MGFFNDIIRTNVRIIEGGWKGLQASYTSNKRKHKENQKQKEIKDMIMMGRRLNDKIGDPGTNFDFSNMAALINYLHFIGMITDIEKIKVQAMYEKE